MRGLRGSLRRLRSRIREAFPKAGTRLLYGSVTDRIRAYVQPARTASTSTKAHSYPLVPNATTSVTWCTTSAGTSSFWLLGPQWGDGDDLTTRVRANKPIGLGSSGIAMEVPGVSGAPRERAV